MANIKESGTSQEYILKYAIVEQLQPIEEDSKLAILSKPFIFIRLEAFPTLWNTANYIRRTTILN